MDDKHVRSHVVSAKTGEITTDLFAGDRIVRSSSNKSFDVKTEAMTEYTKWNLGNFLKTHVAEM